MRFCNYTNTLQHTVNFWVALHMYERITDARDTTKKAKVTFKGKNC